MKVRQAEQHDALQLAELIYASAPKLLSTIFTINAEYSALNFLRNSLKCKHGQYGFANHWVIDIDSQPVASISAWHANMSETFQQSTVQSIISFYPTPEALEVIHLGQSLQDCIPKPVQNEWCVGHLSVSAHQQKKGLGGALLKAMQEQAIVKGKPVLSLDVDISNTEAIKFYQKKGFRQQHLSAVTPRMQTLGLSQHMHMVKRLV